MRSKWGQHFTYTAVKYGGMSPLVLEPLWYWINYLINLKKTLPKAKTGFIWVYAHHHLCLLPLALIWCKGKEFPTYSFYRHHSSWELSEWQIIPYSTLNYLAIKYLLKGIINNTSMYIRLWNEQMLGTWLIKLLNSLRHFIKLLYCFCSGMLTGVWAFKTFKGP